MTRCHVNVERNTLNEMMSLKEYNRIFRVLIIIHGSKITAMPGDCVPSAIL